MSSQADAVRTRVCLHCEEEFSYRVGRGTDRKLCSAQCRQAHQLALRAERHALLPACSTPGCANRATRVGAGQCEGCYYRVRRTGTVERAAPRYRYETPEGYVKLLDASHPLADASGLVFEHRAVVYAQIGDGPHPCFWCGVVIEWRDIVIDHLNEHKGDNRPTNLVVSCNDCNRTRGAMLPFLARMRDAAVPTFICAALAYRADVASAQVVAAAGDTGGEAISTVADHRDRRVSSACIAAFLAKKGARS